MHLFKHLSYIDFIVIFFIFIIVEIFFSIINVYIDDISDDMSFTSLIIIHAFLLILSALIYIYYLRSSLL